MSERVDGLSGSSCKKCCLCMRLGGLNERNMRLIDKYVTKTILSSIFLVLLMLTGLQLFILFVNQLGDLGKGDYGIGQAIKFILLGMPYQVYLFFPMASLLGCLIGLGMMANHRELVVMRAAGMSIAQVTGVVLRIALVLIVVMTLLGELLLPKLVLWANEHKIQALNAGDTLRTAKGVWLRHRRDFIAIGLISPNGSELTQVHQFHFNRGHRIEFIRQIQHVTFAGGTWIAYDVDETQFQERSTHVIHHDSMTWDVALKPRLLRIGSSEPDEMTFQELYQFLQAQKKSHQSIQHYQLGYWQRLVQPFTTLVMMLLAIPFIFGPLRSSTMGSKLLLGATIGFGFYIINRFLGSLSQIYQFSSLAAALLPTVLFAMLGLYFMRRAR